MPASPPAPPAQPPGPPALPSPLTLPALQGYVARIVAARGFTRDVDRIFILLVEELGELAAEFKQRRYYPERYQPRHAAFELVDILLYLLDLANAFGLDVMSLWPEHERSNDERFASRRAGPPTHFVHAGLALNALVAHVEAKRVERAFEDTDEMLLILLTEEIGEISTEVRKGWSGQGDARRLGLELIDALTCVLRLAHRLGFDLELAVADKEAQNAQRVWTY